MPKQESLPASAQYSPAHIRATWNGTGERGGRREGAWFFTSQGIRPDSQGGSFRAAYFTSDEAHASSRRPCSACSKPGGKPEYNDSRT